jgi:FtsZ-binding cell division protein ZapB
MAYDHTFGSIRVNEEQYVKAIKLLEKFNKESIYNLEVKPLDAVRNFIETAYYFSIERGLSQKALELLIMENNEFKERNNEVTEEYNFYKNKTKELTLMNEELTKRLEKEKIKYIQQANFNRTTS